MLGARRVSVLSSTPALGFPGASNSKESTCNVGDLEEGMEEGMATHSSISAWRAPWTEEPGGLQPTRSQESDTTERLSTTTPE